MRLPALPALPGLLLLVRFDPFSAFASFVLRRTHHHHRHDAAHTSSLWSSSMLWWEVSSRSRRRTRRVARPASSADVEERAAAVAASSSSSSSSQPASRMAARTPTPTTTDEAPPSNGAADRRGTPLARFNNLVNYERYDGDDDGDDQGAVVPSALGAGRRGDGSDLELDRSSAGATSSSIAPLTVSFLDLMRMAFRSATSPEMRARRRDFVRELKRRGGYCLVEMDRDDVEARILHGMWDLMGRVLVPTTAAATLEGESDSSPSTMLRRQVLKRSTSNSSNASTASDNPGYDFVQTTIVGGSLRPPWIGERHGSHASRHAADAYTLLAQLCKAFATVVYTGSSNATPADATRLMESLLDDPGRSFSGSYHRLCRYLPLPPQPKDPGAPPNGNDRAWGESLRPHVDWTISTAIPVSSVAGLEVYEPSAAQSQEATRRWVRVERVAHGDWKRKKKSTRNATTEGTETECCWNAHYVVVFAGAWLELLTDGDVEATLHRVVSRRDATTDATAQHKSSRQRLSAPFFMRPKELVFERTDQVFDDPRNEKVAHMNSTEAVRAMGRFLRESEFLRV